jgi:crotonobetainyl-CoA:carnitine CoA-transferase CaiB-like acyl-CoA transferase
MQAMKNRHGSHYIDDFDPQVIAWMKTHTIDDLKHLASEMESKGENVNDVMEVIQDLEEIENGQLPWMGSN